MFLPDFREILFALHEEGAEFLLVGAFAVAVHGVARATGDMDVWVRPDPENARRVWTGLAKYGAPVAGLAPEELSRPGLIFQIGVYPVRVDILTAIEGVEYEDAWAERVEVDIDGFQVPVLSRRHLIANKRACGRPKDLADLALLEERKRE